MKNTMINGIRLAFIIWIGVSCSGKEPLEDIGYKSNERAIEEFRVPGQVGKVRITRTVDSCEIVVKVLEDQIDLTQVCPHILVSIGATVTPASEETVNFAAHGNEYTYQVVSETGLSRDWKVKIEPYALPGWLNKKWRIEPRSASTGGNAAATYKVTGPGDAATTYPGNNPLGALTDHLVTRGYMVFIKTAGSGTWKYTRPMSFYKFAGAVPTVMDEYDNTLEFTYNGFNDDATRILGSFNYGAGTDGKYAEFPEITATTTAATPVTTTVDFGSLLRQIPKGQGTFEFDMANEVLSLYDSGGKLFSTTKTRGTIIDNSGKTANVPKAFTYDEEKGRLQLRFYLPVFQKLPGESTVYKLDRISSNFTPYPYLNLSTAGMSSDLYYQLSGVEEVWYDFIETDE